MESKVLNHLVNLRNARLEKKNPNADKIEFLANDELLKKLCLSNNVSKLNEKIAKEDMYLSEALLFPK